MTSFRLGAHLLLLFEVVGFGCGVTPAASDAPENAGMEDAAAVTTGPHLFGYAVPNVAHQHDEIDQVLGAMQILGNDTTFIRTDLTWGPGHSPDFAGVFDYFAGRLGYYNLRWLPNIHLADATNEALPVDMSSPTGDWQGGIASVVKRYGNGVGFSAPAGWQPMQRFEILNEPNTGTGYSCSAAYPCTHCASNCTTSATCVPDGTSLNGSCTTSPRAVVAQLKTASAVIHGIPRTGGGAFMVVGPALGAIDITYLQELYAVDPHFLSYLDGLSFHLYAAVPATLAPTAMYPAAGWNDPINAHRPQQVQNLRSWMDAHGGSNVALYITEGGYSGSNDRCKPKNVVTEATQASWGIAVLDYFKANPGLKLRFYSPFNLIDSGRYTYPQTLNGSGQCTNTGPNYNYWYENLGAMRADGVTLKPWGAAYQQRIASDGR